MNSILLVKGAATVGSQRHVSGHRTEAKGARSARQPSPLGGWLKRCFDLVCASSALIVFSPIFLMIAALIKVSDVGPVFYRHQRIGFRSRPFSCFKFRTMVVDGDEAFWRYLRISPEAAQEWSEARKLKSDPRVTAVGAILRQLSLDELPQLINIVLGEMSIVGPRPIVSDEIEMYGPHASSYLRARPGLTGAWQVSGRSDVSYDQRVALDRAYVENWSLWADIVIILKTVPAVLTAKGTF
jgi:exopolysaccharide production protein ExoY